MDASASQPLLACDKEDHPIVLQRNINRNFRTIRNQAFFLLGETVFSGALLDYF